MPTAKDVVKWVHEHQKEKDEPDMVFEWDLEIMEREGVFATKVYCDNSVLHRSEFVDAILWELDNLARDGKYRLVLEHDD